MRLLRLEDGSCEILALPDVPDGIKDIPDARSADRKKLVALIKRCALNGISQMPRKVFHHANQQNDIWEFVAGNHRAYCFKEGGRLVVLTSIYRKKQQKAPKSEVSRAIRAKNDYLEAVKNGTLEITEGDQS
ncbi:type II toxin-antitoxin system RelE/ParE family toxin [Guyparkeria halophila]|uniref:type II toxin-antitoxin system RelE/ParE family toxin n=1 Tax=Guyparkeria halophila TaxID=47960 RepID=UPI0018CBF71A|nr:type II toxin-antitoxin system RelE/ParE family toxin [Guyparkeria halophila]